MVGPVGPDERASTLRVIKGGFVVLIGGSAGLIALQADAGLPVIAGVSLAGLVAGTGLVRVAFPAAGDVERRPPRRR